MSIFATNNHVEESEIIAAEGYDVTLGGACDLVIESCMDEMAVIEAMHAFDMAELEAVKESGNNETLTPAMEASMKEVWDKIKTFFKKMYERIMGFFNNAMDFVNSIVMSGSAFAKKYEERLNKVSLSGFTYEMYEYNFESIFAKGISAVDARVADVEKLMGKLSDMDVAKDSAVINTDLAKIQTEIEQNKDAHLTALRKELSGAQTADAYRSELAKKFRNGGSKKSMTITDLQKYVKFLKTSNGLIKHIEGCKNSMKAKFAAMDKDINKAAQNAMKADGNGQYAHIASKKAHLMRQCIQWNGSINNILTGYINEWSSAVKEAVFTYKNLCFKAMQHKPAK